MVQRHCRGHLDAFSGECNRVHQRIHLEFRSRVPSMAEPRFGRSLLLDPACPFMVRALKTASQVRHKCAVRSF